MARESATAIRVVSAVMAVLLVLAIFPYTPSPAGDIKYLLLGIFTLALTVLWALDRAESPRPWTRPSGLLLILAAFFGLNMAAALFSDHAAHSLEYVRRLGVCVMLYVTVAHAFRTPRQAWRLMAAICLAVAVSSLYGFCQKAGLDPFPWAGRATEEYRGLPSTYGNPNLAAHALCLAMVMGVGLALRKGTRWCAVLVPIMAAHFWLTGIRSGKVALAAALTLVIAAWLVRRRRYGPLKGTLTTCLLVAAVAGAAGVAGTTVTKCRTGRFMPVDSSLVLRYNSNYGAARMALDRPLLGYGPGNYAIENPPYWTPYEQSWFAVERLYSEHVHNDYAEFVVDAGFGALALYVAFMAYLIAGSVLLFFTSHETDRRKLALMLGACAMAFAVEGLFAFNARVPVSGALIFILAGLLDGVLATGSPAAHGRRSGLRAGARWAVVLLVLLGAIAEGRSFSAAFLHQRAKGAGYWGDHEAARARLATAEKLAPWNWLISRDLGATAWRLGRRDEALEALNRSLAQHPAYVLTHVDLAKAWCERAADEMAASGSSDGPGDAATMALERAERFANAALDLCPVMPEANEALGLVHAIQARTRDAGPGQPAGEEAWRQACARYHGALRFAEDPALRGRLLGGAAEALDALADVSQAEAMFRAAAQANPDDMGLWRQYTDFAAKRGKWEGLAEAMERGLGQVSQTDLWGSTRAAVLTQQLAHVYANFLNAPDSAVAVLARGLTAAPERVELWAALAALPESRAREAALRNAVVTSMSHWTSEGAAPLVAVEVLASAYRRDPEKLAEAAGRLKRLCASRASAAPPDVLAKEYGWVAPFALDEVGDMALPPGVGAGLLRDLAALSVMSARWEDANKTLLFALDVLPDQEQDSFLLVRAQVLSELNRHAEARNLILHALSRRPGNVATQWAHARILAAGGQREEARDAYLRLAESAQVGEETRQRIEREMADLIDEDDAKENSSDES
jgi:O-antigen ligase